MSAVFVEIILIITNLIKKKKCIKRDVGDEKVVFNDWTENDRHEFVANFHHLYVYPFITSGDVYPFLRQASHQTMLVVSIVINNDY